MKSNSRPICATRAARLLSVRMVLAMLMLAPLLAPAQKPVVIDGTGPGKTFDGIGAVSAGASSRLLIDYPEPQRSEILDYLFKPNYGASLQHLKVEIGGDVNSTDGSEPSHMRSATDHDYDRGYEWWLMLEARKRNPDIILDTLAWGAPGWVGNETLYTESMAKYVSDFLTGAEREHQLSIRLTGSWNEREFDSAYIKTLHKQLAQDNPGVKLVCCDEFSSREWDIVDAMRKDPELAASVDIVAVHYPRKDGKLTTPAAARTLGLPLWSSEDQPESSASIIRSRDWAIGGRSLSKLYNRNYLEGGFSATEIWSPVTSYYDILAAPNSGLMYANTPWSGSYEVQGAIWATAHTTQFAQPGWRYLDRASGMLPEKGSYVTLKDTKSPNWSTIVETIDAKTMQSMNFQLAGQVATTTVHIWETNAARTFEHVADVNPKNGKFHVDLDPDSLYSLTTTTGQSRGTATPPPPAKFPFPYQLDLESTRAGRSPRYLADQDGAFEVHPCEGHAGNCLEQMIDKKPIPWGPLPNPWTLTGDESWKDYQVATSALVAKGGLIALLGRIDSANVFADKSALWPAGYILTLEDQGTWQLTSTVYKEPPHILAAGKVPMKPQSWHNLTLRFAGDRIVAELDGSVIASVQNTMHKQGMVGLGSDWTKPRFASLNVK